MPLDVAVQVVNYRTRRHLEGCLASVLDDLADGGLEHRVLVLDNASGDDLSALAARFSGVEFDTADRNVGFGAAHNRLAGYHDAASILLLNPDATIVEPRTVARLVSALRHGVAAVGPQLVSASGAVDPLDHGELHGLRARFAQAAGHSHYRRRDEPADAAWVSAAACLVARSWFDRVGGFDPGFFLFKEEEDLFLRIRRAGGRVVYHPLVRVRHDGGAVASRDEHMEASIARFADKHVRAPQLIQPVHRVVTAWGGRLGRLLGH